MKELIITCSALLLSGVVFAQNMEGRSTVDWNPNVYRIGELYPGYIIKMDGDTVKGFIKAKQRCAIDGMIGSNNQTSVDFYLNQSDRKPAVKYKPDELKGYKIADKIYESINYSGGLFKKPNFNLVVRDGAIRIYEWYSTVSGFSSIRMQSGESWQSYDNRRYEKRVVIAKDPKTAMEYGMLGLSFSKNMSALVQDNPELMEKVKSKAKGYTLLDLFDVIEEYNNWAETK